MVVQSSGNKAQTGLGLDLKGGEKGWKEDSITEDRFTT